MPGLGPCEREPLPTFEQHLHGFLSLLRLFHPGLNSAPLHPRFNLVNVHRHPGPAVPRSRPDPFLVDGMARTTAAWGPHHLLLPHNLQGSDTLTPDTLGPCVQPNKPRRNQPLPWHVCGKPSSQRGRPAGGY